MIRSDFHMHTTFSDGKHTPEEMVLTAIEKGLSAIGFSEHAYVPFDPDCSMSPERTHLYRAEISRLKEKYEGRIDILCGIEMDYFSEDDPAAYDYVIGSLHYLRVKGEIYATDLSPKETRRCIDGAFGGDSDSYAEAYFETLSHVKEKTDADIIGHFDLITKYENRGVALPVEDARYTAAMKSAIDALARKAVFEINTGAISRGYKSAPYPSLDILRELKAKGGGVILSSDAHRKENICACFSEGQGFLRAAGFESATFTDRAGHKHVQV